MTEIADTLYLFGDSRPPILLLCLNVLRYTFYEV